MPARRIIRGAQHRQSGAGLSAGCGAHGVSAALEYAVSVLRQTHRGARPRAVAASRLHRQYRAAVPEISSAMDVDVIKPASGSSSATTKHAGFTIRIEKRRCSAAWKTC